jgi:hypothetical protein
MPPRWRCVSIFYPPDATSFLRLRLAAPGYYDTQYDDRVVPDCRGRVRTDNEGRFGYRAVVPVAYPIPNDVRRCHRLFIQGISFLIHLLELGPRF